MRHCTPEHPLKLAVLISGNGTNLEAIIEAISDGLPAEICVVLSNKVDAYGLERARHADISTEVLPDPSEMDKDAYDHLLIEKLKPYQPELIVLAGFMRVLTPTFVEYFKHRIINIHPSLLPKHPGLHTHAKVMLAKDKKHGATVHVVTAKLDNGPIIIQAAFETSEIDDVHSLRNKVHTLEHKIYPYVIQLYAAGRLAFQDDAVLLDGEVLPETGLEYRLHY